ncbi:MAG: proline dehydrogenase family protein [Anaerolineae bacterium]|nr:proline dehydrogenase family protein [Anaerolineae bacterium]
MLRSLFLYLSQAAWARGLIMHIGLARRTAYRFVAGETLPDAIDTVRRLNTSGLDVTLDLLGESVVDEAGARAAADEYIKLLDAIAASDVKATVSLKLTQLGLDIDEALCRDTMRRILTHANTTGSHITIDMESSDYTDVTLAIYRALRHEDRFENVGIVIQAYLYRSEDDMRALAQTGAFVRLCKGAYKEPPDRAFADKADVDANFVHLMQHFLTPEACAAGAYLGIATHDDNMISASKTHITAHNISPDSFEFQMLYGIRPKLQEQLRDDGYTMRVYVPYGTQWYPYFMRRLAERPANIWFFVSNFFRR